MTITISSYLKRFPTMPRYSGFAGALVLLAILSACTTVEGTNAFVDAGTFEREVMSETLRGLGVLEREQKQPLETPRAPLVLPIQTASLPTPTDGNQDMLPQDSDNVQIDVSNISDADLARLRNARVVDLRTLSGRPLTETETRRFTAKMNADSRLANADRPLYLPPERYYTTINSVDLVCLAPNGDLVQLDDPACPAEIRAALQTN